MKFYYPCLLNVQLLVKYLLKKVAAGTVKAAAVWRPEQRSCREGAANSADILSHQNPHLRLVNYILKNLQGALFH